MAIQLTPEQEQRVKAAVNSGACPSAEEALDAAVAAMESIASAGFEGTVEELDALLTEGLDSGDAVEANDAFWRRLTEKTDQMVDEHRARNPRK
jgi:hypothetical protein